MPTTTSPPVLIWQPEGGIPGGTPISNPPVYSQADVTPLIIGQAYVDVVFGSVQTDTTWVLVECDVVNTTDLTPLNIWPGIITNRTTAGFRVYLNGLPDSGDYFLHWAVSGVNIVPHAATTYLFTGPTSSPFGVDAIFTVKLPPSTTGMVHVIPDDGGAGGVFSPVSVTLIDSSATATFSYSAASYGAKTISVTNSGTLVDPAPIIFTSIAPTYTFSGPSTGDVGVASTNFTVQAAGEATFPVPVTITPSAGGGGGTFTPSSVTISTGDVLKHFTYTPASGGAKTISVTNSGGLANPAPLTYTATSPVHLLNTLISYWKLDEAAGVTKNDSVGTNHLPDPTSCSSFPGLITNCTYFGGANYLGGFNNASLQVTGSFTFSFWVHLDTVAGTQIIILKSDFASNQDYILYYVPGAGIQFTVNGVSVNLGSDLATSVWIHVVGWYDSGDQKLRLRINDATTYVSAATASLVQTSILFTVGGGTSGGIKLVGALDEMGFWKRVLTATEITALYNGGAGLPFSSFTA